MHRVAEDRSIDRSVDRALTGWIRDSAAGNDAVPTGDNDARRITRRGM